jgi:hypothetical protein
VHHERVEVVGEAFGGGGVAGVVELVDQRLEPLLAVAFAGGVIERLPVGLAHAFALALGQLGEQVAARARPRRARSTAGAAQAPRGGGLASGARSGASGWSDCWRPRRSPARSKGRAPRWR